MRVQQLCWFAVLKSQKRRSGTIPDRQDAAVRVFKRSSSNEAAPSMEMKRYMGPMKRELGGR
eukprot:9202433-Pyramimonas_sp.AAC.1